jgi:hypothetical protein
MDTSNWRTISLVVIVITLFLGAVAWITVTMGQEAAQWRLLTWKVVSADRVEVEFEVRNSSQEPAFCILRAQDEKHVDLAYATVEVPPGSGYARVPYELTTLAPAFAVELLGCAIGEDPRVAPPNFPPGVAPPQQQ